MLWTQFTINYLNTASVIKQWCFRMILTLNAYFYVSIKTPYFVGSSQS